MVGFYFEVYHSKPLKADKPKRVFIVADDEETAKGEMAAQYPEASYIFLHFKFDEMILPDDWMTDDDTDDDTGEDWPEDEPDGPQPHEEEPFFYN